MIPEDQNKKKKPSIISDKKQQQIDDRLRIQQLILKLTEDKAQEKFEDYRLDRENEKIKLLSGAEITIHGIRKVIADSIQKCGPMFGEDTEFFQQVYRLKGWPKEELVKYRKRPEMAKIINYLIYRRFFNELLPIVQGLNPYVKDYMRRYKHYQLLTEAAREKEAEFISQAVELMKECTSWYEFRVRYAKKYNWQVQLDAFEDNSII